MSIPIYQVDAFASAPFTGNPAAVCLLDGPADAGWMQNVATEMNLSETAFLYLTNDVYSLRWFTPEVEVDLCGHATLASAHVLYENATLAVDEPARFLTASGLLTVHKNDDGTLSMDFPATPPVEDTPPQDLAAVLGFEPLWTGRSRFDLFAVAPGEATVRGLDPDPAIVAKLSARGVIVTAQADAGNEYDFVSRFFAPGSGVPEDPVTGSAHCALGPYWAKELNQETLIGYQASRRGGSVWLRVAGERIELRGRATTVLRGELEA